ncbi:MAG: hypothetical protein E7160_03065 [Firmicutes bacterium]|nr:hypothetical protein [Bacillota bacterium]
MANDYKPGKWTGPLQADIQGDATKTTPTLGDNFDIELANLKVAQKNITNTIKSIKKETQALQNHSETGKMATDYLKLTIKHLEKIEQSMDKAVNDLSKAVTSAQREEWNRYRKLLAEWAAKQSQ